MTGTQETSVDAVMCHPSAPSGTKDSPPPPADAALLPEEQGSNVLILNSNLVLFAAN